MGLAWIEAGAQASAARAAERAIRRNAADKIKQMRHALEHSTTSDLWQSIERPIFQESLHDRLSVIWMAIQEVKGVDKSTAQSFFNKTLWLSVKQERLAPTMPGYMEFWHALATSGFRGPWRKWILFSTHHLKRYPG